MTALKILTIINWIIAGIWALGILFAMFAPKGQTDAAGQGQLAGMIILGILALALLVWLNWLPYTWTKIVALIIGMLLMLIVWNVVKDGV